MFGRLPLRRCVRGRAAENDFWHEQLQTTVHMLDSEALRAWEGLLAAETDVGA